ncbi:uncharacterized protein N7515_007609 [Penicillium bovifimosum]|uniref:Xylanolytic transcriptional activator regulatory domain-containing protein n=1 Tax=Penicillium bovifimosum TaxID=126998 RepID=A0A9W9L2A1_9EURO|nr:uncharacterized protein N7515_007609 [Penicillium bovifimosum]KAJ5131570.1 hypothetical protein N7515_007609 [Penicillium bovifimosum]
MGLNVSHVAYPTFRLSDQIPSFSLRFDPPVIAIMNHSASASQPRPKRRKIAVACDDCRARKVRCDGVQPAALESRIQRLESPRYPETAQTAGTPLRACLSSPTPGTARSPTPANYTRSTHRQGDISTPTSQLDGVNAMMGAVDEERAYQGFFGSSSAAGFMRQVKTAVDRRVASPHQRCSVPNPPIPSSLMPTRGERQQSSVASYVLPPRRMADSLMEVYWDYVFPLYPFLEPAQLKAEYAKIWTGDGLVYDENMLMCTLNVIFALSSQLADFVPPKDREASADAFFPAPKGYFNSIFGILALLGLHLPQHIARLQTFRERQLARKIWHGCILMDRVISMTFGRPAMISKASSGAVPLPVAVDDEYIPVDSSKEVSQPSDCPSMMAFYAKSLELYEIMNDVLLSLYKPISDESSEDAHEFTFDNVTGEGERTIFQIDRSLTQWTRSLPPHLRGGSSESSANPIFCRQKVVLRARFLHVRMLLFRSTLSKYCAVRDNTTTGPLVSAYDSFPHRVALQCSIICVKTAQESIELIHNNVPADGTGGPLPAWWYNILYVYTSATVLIAGRLCSAILAEVTENSIAQSWNYALEVLRKYQTYSTSARRCVAALEILYEQVASEGLLPTDNSSSHNIDTSAGVVNDESFGEAINAAIMDHFEFPDFQDMSWLNSVPSNLF